MHRVGQKYKYIQSLVRKLEGTRQLWRPKHKVEDYIKINFKEVGCAGVVWI
jgi:hypothetical protein